MKEPVIANALDEAAKREILNNVSDTMTREELLARYVDAFLKQNRIENNETREISLRKAIASVVLGIVLFLEICWFMLYHPAFSELSAKLVLLAVILIETAICLFFLQGQSMRAYLIREVIRRPDDSIDNILISQVSGSRSGFANLVRVLLPLFLALAASAILFFKPHMIFEKNDMGGYSVRYYTASLVPEQYSVRYYTASLVPEQTVAVPETHNGLPVNEIRGNVFQGLGFTEITLPSGLTQIRASSFEGCKNLRSIDIPYGVTRIAAHAFCDCASLQYVNVPATVEEIRSSAFRRCYHLYEIKIPEKTVVNEKAFKESPTRVIRY